LEFHFACHPSAYESPVLCSALADIDHVFEGLTENFEWIVQQVIGFVHTVLKKMDLGLKTVLIVVPVNVLHNWRSEFHKWQPGNESPIPVYMLEDVARLVLAC